MFRENFKKLVKVFVLGLIFTFLACNTAPSSQAKNVLVEHDAPMFWEIKGEKGSIFIQGTIEAGTDELYPLDAKVLKAFDSADKIYGELSFEDYAEFAMELAGKGLEMVIDPSENQAMPLLNNKEKTVVKNLLKDLGEDGYEVFEKSEPWLMRNTIEALAITKIYDTEKGVDAYFYMSAFENDKSILGLDSPETKLNVLTFGTHDEQMLMLKDTISAINDKSFYNDVKKLFDLYMTDKRDEFANLIEHRTDNLPSDLAKKYKTVAFTDRNKNWAKTFETLLDKGGNVFVFAGAGHFVGKESVFEIMKKNGSLK